MLEQTTLARLLSMTVLPYPHTITHEPLTQTLILPWRLEGPPYNSTLLLTQVSVTMGQKASGLILLGYVFSLSHLILNSW